MKCYLYIKLISEIKLRFHFSNDVHVFEKLIGINSSFLTLNSLIHSIYLFTKLVVNIILNFMIHRHLIKMNKSKNIKDCNFSNSISSLLILKITL